MNIMLNFNPLEILIFQSSLGSSSMLKLVELLHVPNITRNLIYASKFAKDSHM